MAAWNSFDNAVEAQQVQVVRHAAEGIVSRVKASGCATRVRIQIGEASELKTEECTTTASRA